MNLYSLITGPARAGLAIGARVVGAVRDRLGDGTIDDDALQENVVERVFSTRKVSRSRVEVNVTEGVVWLRGEVRSEGAIEEAERLAGGVIGVDRVENLLRVAKAPAKPKGQKRPAPKRSARPKPAAATAKPPSAEPVAPAPTGPSTVKDAPGTPQAEDPTDAEPGTPAAPTAPEPTAAPGAAPGTPQAEPSAAEGAPRRFTSEETPAEAEPSPRELADRGEGRQPAPLGATPAPVGSGESPAAPFPHPGNGNGSGNAPDGGNGPTREGPGAE